MNTEIFNALMIWDSRETSYKEKLYARFCVQKNFMEDLVEIYEKEAVFRLEATWLIRQHLEQKNTISETHLKTILKHTKILDHWWAKANVLRIITLGLKTKKLIPLAETFVRNCLKSKKTAVRAFAHESFRTLALYDHKYQKEAIDYCESGLNSRFPFIFVKSRDTLKKLTSS